MRNRYIVLSPINEGHKIYLAKNIQNNRICVKKKMRIYNLDVYKYLKETKPKGIPEIFDYEIEDGSLIVYEEYIEGIDLQEQLNNNTKFSKDEIYDICSQICSILDNLNQSSMRIVHRDIKPSNIIYGNGKVYLIDFNAAKIEDESKDRDTVLLGTEGYAAPEQYGFGTSTIKSDIYSIGVLLNELAINSNVQDSIINRIYEKCTMIDPDKRYSTYKALNFDLKYPSTYGSRRYYPVGFRTLKPIKMVIAVNGYLLIVLMFSGLVTTDGNMIATYMDRIYFMILSFVLVSFLGNYLNWWEKWGYKNSWNKMLKALWVVFFFFVVFLIPTIAFLLLQGIVMQIFK